ncbi:MAG: hypothetical protein DMF61_25440 [Blastocatellia bacterium AA13]|nr:MAG: hypothetical protein DMF61_25440 [Blastocatellia bacterium AA13]
MPPIYIAKMFVIVGFGISVSARIVSSALLPRPTAEIKASSKSAAAPPPAFIVIAIIAVPALLVAHQCRWSRQRSDCRSPRGYSYNRDEQKQNTSKNHLLRNIRFHTLIPFFILSPTLVRFSTHSQPSIGRVNFVVLRDCRPVTPGLKQVLCRFSNEP